ncbi:MAG: hypothetical protein V3T77_04860, partial [Planctomycetota bacterium]
EKPAKEWQLQVDPESAVNQKLHLETWLNGSPPEVIAFDGKALFAMELSDGVREERTAKLVLARHEYDQEPEDVEALIWLGRRTAYLGSYQRAVQIYSEGLKIHPEEPRLYRHRGHRHITLRKFPEAIADLEQACQLIQGAPDQVEPDGLPNTRNTPTSTTHSNIWYHLGLAYYLSGDFANAERGYRNCLEYSKNPDMLCATSHWLYMSLRRQGKHQEAEQVLKAITEDMDIIENHAYFELLLMYKGLRTPDAILEKSRAQGGLGFATSAYGVANWHLANGDRKQALPIFKEMVRSEFWPAFGYIAAEADLERIRSAAKE